MSNAPAGWYADPGAPGGARYWTGAAWLAPGVGPTVAAPSLAPQATSFAPQATSFEPQATSFAPQTEFLQAPTFADSQEQVRPVASEYLQPRAPEYPQVPDEDPVPWDVVGVPRTTDVAGANPATQAQWQGSAPQPYGRVGERVAFAPSYYAPEPPYGSLASGRKRRSGWVKVATIVAAIVVALGVRWGVGQVLNGDYSDDGRIEVTTPVTWTTHSADDPDIIYAMDSSWATVPVDANSELKGTGFRVIEMRSLTADPAGEQGIVILGGSTFSVPAAHADRKDFEGALAQNKDALEGLGSSNVSFDELEVLRSRAGDRWGVQTASFSLKGIAVSDYMAVAMIDGYAVVVQVIVPDGAGFTRNDLLKVVNSISAK